MKSTVIISHIIKTVRGRISQYIYLFQTLLFFPSMQNISKNNLRYLSKWPSSLLNYQHSLQNLASQKNGYLTIKSNMYVQSLFYLTSHHLTYDYLIFLQHFLLLIFSSNSIYHSENSLWNSFVKTWFSVIIIDLYRIQCLKFFCQCTSYLDIIIKSYFICFLNFLIN